MHADLAEIDIGYVKYHSNNLNFTFGARRIFCEFSYLLYLRIEWESRELTQNILGLNFQLRIAALSLRNRSISEVYGYW